MLVILMHGVCVAMKILPLRVWYNLTLVHLFLKLLRSWAIKIAQISWIQVHNVWHVVQLTLLLCLYFDMNLYIYAHVVGNVDECGHTYCSLIVVYTWKKIRGNIHFHFLCKNTYRPAGVVYASILLTSIFAYTMCSYFCSSFVKVDVKLGLD